MTLNSLLFIVIVYLIKEKITIFKVHLIPTWTLHLIYVLIPIPLSLLILKTSKLLKKDSIEGKILQIEEANNAYLPSYLGYFFVALSVPDTYTFLFVFSILFIFVYFSQTHYFNPVFLLLKYHFYYVTTDDNCMNIIISKRTFEGENELEFMNLRRINYHTYIDEEVE
ncbi:hypothetical protein J4772_31725 [Cohnella sp. LGH]|nr:hypothetical protein J4772_31725 [Cohnella sp. LGH]